MRGRLAGVALLIAFGCAPTIAPAPPPCTEVKHVIGRSLAPNLMLLIDRSATHSQKLPELLNAISFFVASQPTLGRYGVTVFPHDASCGAATASEVLLDFPDAGSLDHDVDLQAQSDLAVFALGSVTATGQASLADSLRFVDSMPQMRDGRRSHTIILFTSGLPDCGDGGLDDTVAALTELKNDDTRTVVVGFDLDLADAGTVDAFNSLARYGATAGACPHGLDRECGFVDDPDGGADAGHGARCNTQTMVCEPAFVVASNGMELTAGLSQLDQLSAGGGFSCVFPLEHPPANESMVSVYFDGVEVPRCDGGTDCDTWVYDPNVGIASVRLLGQTCQRLFDATPNDPLTIAIRIDGCDGSKPPQ
ncbi:MAG: VWA domain-containing protein [Myxococcaceae bacterium]